MCAYMLRTCVSMGVVLGIEPRTSCMLSKDSITELQQVGKSSKMVLGQKVETELDLQYSTVCANTT